MRVLIAEDDPTVSELLQDAVGDLGYIFTAAHDGTEAWAKYLDWKPDVVLLDWVLPGVDGVELCRRMRDPNQHHGGYTYVIFLTALRDASRLAEAMRSGADDYLTKPFDLAALEMRLKVAQRITSLYAERKQHEEELRHRALHDPLTGLPNRSLFHDRLTQAITTAARARGPAALLLIDLDGFKHVNDTLGHETGDLVLQHVASALRAAIRGADTAARLGGDEFAVVLPGADGAGATRAATSVLAGIATLPDALAGKLRAGASIGIALYPRDGDDVATLLRHADGAMYEAKRGGAGFALYTASRREAGA
jgi:diguanylate cyclase (GGDEF)-like protein